MERDGPAIRDNLQFVTVKAILNFNLLELKALLTNVKERLSEITS